MAKPIKTVLLLALPASGKSEVRTYLDSLSPAECLEHFHIGHTVQLDDYPYVHLMRCIDDELAALGQDRAFFHAGDKPFKDSIDWGTLIALINMDYEDLISARRISVKSSGAWLFERMDSARAAVGGMPVFSALSRGTISELEARLKSETDKLLDDKNRGIVDDLEGKTVVIEFARGGADGSSMPLPDCFGYQYSLRMLSHEILKEAAILYIWVTPEESRRKNFARSKPGEQGSILFHGVPIDVMLGDYGCDDMEYLIGISEQPDTVTVIKDGKKYLLPVGRFDNRIDKTSFIRDFARESWPEGDLAKLREGLNSAFSALLEQHARLHG